MTSVFCKRSTLSLLLAGAAVMVATQVSAEELVGRVTSQATGNALAGALVRVPELGRQVITGKDGGYVLPNVAPGAYNLEVSYQGLDRRSVSVDVAPGAATRQDIGLTSGEFDVGEILVVARLEGQAGAINLQRSAASVRTVVSADALGQIREGNIGDALVRLPGLSVETRAGVQRTATIRGLAPQYNTVTVDGLRMTNVDGNRDIALDSFPSNMLARVEVIKAPTPDMSADAIGGTVDLIPRSAFDHGGRVIEGQIGGTYNDLRENWNYQVGATLADTFGPDKQFGVLGSVYYWHDERGYDAVESAYTVGANNLYALNRAYYYDRAETKDRVGAGLVVDYRPTDDTAFFFKALYSYDYRHLNQRGTDWRPNTATQFNMSNTAGSSTGGRVDAIVFYREPKNVFQMYTLGGRHRVDSWSLDGRVAYSKAQKEYPKTLQVLNSFTNVNMTYARAEADFPTFRVDNAVNVTNPAGLAFRQFDTNQVPRTEDEWSADANALREFTGGRFPMTLKVGARATWKDAAQAQPLTTRYTGLAAGQTPQGLLDLYTNPDFMAQSSGPSQLLGFFPDWRRYLALQQTNPAAFTQTAAARQYIAETIANADFSIKENIYAGYAMGSMQIDNLNVLAGVRVERTEVSSQANRVTVNGTVVTATPVSASNSYTNVLPGVHLRYTGMGDRLVLRGAVTKAISRPPPGDLVASRQENAQLNQRIIGNPNLVPAESLNIDATAEYFFPPLGLLSAGVFYKDIEKFVFSSSRIAADGVDERTRVNGEGGVVRGLELTWVQQFRSLPGVLSGLGAEANFTYLDSEATYPGRADKRPLVNSPRYIMNGIVSYTAGPMDLRLSYNRLPKRLEAVGTSANMDRYNAEMATWDFAAKLKVYQRTSLFLNIKNLTNEPTVQYQGSRSNPTSVVYYGRQFNFGANLSF